MSTDGLTASPALPGFTLRGDGSTFASAFTMRASLPIAGSRLMGRIHSLFGRIHLLEQHAIALHDAFHDRAMRGDATAVIQTLHQAEMWLKAATDDAVVAHVEDLVAGATARLSSLGRTQ